MPGTSKRTVLFVASVQECILRRCTVIVGPHRVLAIRWNAARFAMHHQNELVPFRVHRKMNFLAFKMKRFGNVLKRFGNVLKRFGNVLKRFGNVLKLFGNVLKRFGNVLKRYGTYFLFVCT